MYSSAMRTGLVSVSIFLCLLSKAQQFGGNPSYLKWKQINTDTARIIFPAGIEPTANRVAAVIHELQKNHSSTIGGKLRKVNIVLQDQNTLSNGYVGLGPYRSEFYLFAPQNSFDQGSLNWADNLSVHEYRHIQQYSNFNEGITKAASILFGQEGRAVVNSAAVPDYFFEGDAVFNETVLSRQGRGRQPLFFNGYQALMRQNRHYSYLKLRNGSLRDYVPNHYELGYLLVGYGREKYGADFWKKVTQDAVRFKPLFYPWQGAVQKYAGITYKQFVANAFDYYQTIWQQSKIVAPKYITDAKKDRTDYQYPYSAEEGAVVVLKRSNRQVPAFYKVFMNGTEKKIATRDIAYDDYFSYNNNKILYATLKPDVRWSYREFSDIKLMDVTTGNIQKITSKERFFSPDISHNGQLIAAVEMKTNQLSNIIVMDLHGKRTYRVAGLPGIIYTYPKFSANDAMLYTAVRNAKGEMALLQIDMNNSKKTDVLPFANRIIGFPTVQGDTIFFSSSYKGRDELWAFIESTKAVYRVASNPGGLYQAAFDHSTNQLISSNFTADGYRLAAIPATSLLWQRVNNKENTLPDLYIPGALSQDDSSTLNNIPPRDFAISKYRKSYNLFNFHSWRPYYDQPELSLILYGQNILNTFQTSVGYTYNGNEKSHQLELNAIYGGWYIQPNLAISQTWNRTINFSRDTTLFYNEKNAAFGLSLPLNLSGGRQYRYLNFSSGVNTKQVRLTGLGKRFYNNRDFNFIENRIFYSGQIQKAVQHIYPHWAQTVLVQYRNIINKYTAQQFLATGSLYLPGLHPSHNLVLSAAYAARDTMNQYYFSNDFPFSRGFNSVDFPRMWRFGANYHFPLLYPDFGFANIVYFRRIRANGFYDYTQTKSLRSGSKSFFSSTGAELFFDTKWWNQQNVTLGIRYSHLLNKEYRGATQPNQWEIILPINLLN